MKRTPIGLLSVLAIAAPLGMAQAQDMPAKAPPPSALPATECDLISPYPQGGCWYAGAEATYLHASRDGSAISLSPGTPGVSISSANFNPPWGAGGRAWLGYEIFQGWGIRARFWDFYDDQNVTIAPTPGGGLNFANGTLGLRAYNTDLEATKDFRLGSLVLEGALGARYAQLDQSQALIATSSTVAESAAASRDIHGTGVTGFFEARYTLPTTYVSVFANVRDSALWGNDSGEVAGTINASRAFLQNTLGNRLSILETQIGAEWDPPLACRCGTLFVRAAYEFQQWTAPNNLGLVLIGVPGFSAKPESANVIFNGFAFAVGLYR